MEANQFSRTALLTACIRAHHAANEGPKIFDDFLAHRLVTREERQAVGRLLDEDRQAEPPKEGAFPDRATARSRLRAIAGSILARARYAEDALERAIRWGIRQYVILGAGMDTFALRRPELLKSGLCVYEIDHPATQAFKRRRIAQAGLETPEALHFIPVDFAKESLSAVLKRSPFNRNAPAFFSWLGVTYYLTYSEVTATFGAIADISRPGAGIVFDYLDKGFFEPDNPHRSVHDLLESMRNAGEPMRTGFDPAALAEELEPMGFRILEDLNAGEVQTRFLIGHTGRYRTGLYAHIARAERV